MNQVPSHKGAAGPSRQDYASKEVAPQRVAVIGLGAWGAALALYCARLGLQVTAWHRNGAHIKTLRDAKELRITTKFTAPLSNNISLTANLAECQAADLTIIALPASAWGEVLPILRPKGTIISATKGLERSSNLTPLTYSHMKLGIEQDKLCVISGPSFAKDLAEQTPLSLVAASSNQTTAALVATTLSSKSVRVYTSNDPLGVELGGILKNIIAIAVGISDALNYGPSTRAALITRGLAEMTRIAVALGAEQRTLTGLSGLGDLVMTATDDQSRNRIVGLRLGKGESISQILSSLGSTAEGVLSAPLVAQIAAERSIEAPIIELVVRVLRGEIAPNELADQLMLRPLREEFSA